MDQDHRAEPASRLLVALETATWPSLSASGSASRSLGGK